MRTIIVHDNAAGVAMIADIAADMRPSFNDNYCFRRITQQSGKRGAGQAGPDYQYLAVTHCASRASCQALLRLRRQSNDNSEAFRTQPGRGKIDDRSTGLQGWE